MVALLEENDYLSDIDIQRQLLKTAIEINNPEALDYLLKLGMNPNIDIIQNIGYFKGGTDVMHIPLIVYAAEMKTEKGDCSVPLLDVLVNNGADINGKTKPNGDFTALSAVLFLKSEKCAVWLIEHGIDIAFRNSLGENYLMAAAIVAEGGEINLVKIMLDIGIDVNQTRQKGYTALMMATMGNAYGAITYLLQHGADPSLKSNEGLTALDYARKKGYIKIVQLLEPR